MSKTILKVETVSTFSTTYHVSLYKKKKIK